MKARFTCAAIVVALLLAAPAGAQDRQDVRLASDIARNVNTNTRFTIFDDLSISVENGLVTLTGKVTMPYKRDDIA
jgi:osmotically-inducible protein OsmY